MAATAADIVSRMEYEAWSSSLIGAAPSGSSVMLRICSAFGGLSTVRQSMNLSSAMVSIHFLPSGRTVCIQRNGFLGCFGVVVLLTFGLTCAVAFSPLVWQVVWVVSWVVSVFLLLNLHFVGPGYIGFPGASRSPGPHRTIELSSDVRIRCQHCRSCSILRPPRASHCRLCGCCVARFDHHCVLLGSCVGRDNIRYFVSFVWLTLFIIIATFSVALDALDNGHYISALIVVVVDTLCVIPVAAVSVFYFICYVVYGVTLREWKRRGAPFVGVELEESWSIVPRPFSRGLVGNFQTLFARPMDDFPSSTPAVLVDADQSDLS